MCFRALCSTRCAISGSRACRTRVCKRGTCQGFIACAGIAHLMGSLNKEAEKSGAPVRVHCLSPGMVLTDLLLAGATDRNKQVWYALASLKGSLLFCQRPSFNPRHPALDRSMLDVQTAIAATGCMILFVYPESMLQSACHALWKEGNFHRSCVCRLHGKAL